jgi:hypothetical protein
MSKKCWRAEIPQYRGKLLIQSQYLQLPCGSVYVHIFHEGLSCLMTVEEELQ